MSEEYKSPWQIEHEKMLHQQEAEILAQRRRERMRFLRGLKITRKSDPNLKQLNEKTTEAAVSEEKDRETSSKADRKVKKTYLANFDHLRKSWPILVLLMLVFFGSVYSLSPLNRISSFDVKGNTIVGSTDIASASELTMEDSIYDIYKRRSSIESKVINSSPRIRDARLTIKFPNKVTIQITEYQPIGYVEQKGKAYTILSNGSKLSESAMSTDKEAANSLVLKEFSDQQVKEFALAYSELTPEIQTLMRGVSLTPSQSTSDFITIQMSDGNQVKVPLSQMKQKLPYYTSVAEQVTPPMTIDMEIGIFADSTPNYNANFADDNPAGLSKSLSASKKAEAEGSSSDEEATSTDE